MTPHRVASRQCHSGSGCWISCKRHGQTASRIVGRAMLPAGLVLVLGALLLPEQAGAWWYGRTSFPRHRPEYRYSIPPGAPLSYDDPASGTTYCLSQTTGFYFACAYNPPPVVSPRSLPPPPPTVAGPPGDPRTAPASGVLMFRLPGGAQASINGVPIGLNDGFGVQALRPGTHRIVLQVAGKETTHTVNVVSHAIFTVTPAGVVATEP